jgi:hypothetical protein
MAYGVKVSKDNFVFTKFGVATVGTLPKNIEILGVSGIGRCTEFQRIELRTEESASKRDATRLVTQTTDSVLLPDMLMFSEKIQDAYQFISNNEVEFYNPRQIPEFSPSLSSEVVDMRSEEAYGIGLLGKSVYQDKNHLVFLLRKADEKEYLAFVEQVTNLLIRKSKLKIEAKVKKGKLGYAWVVLKGRAMQQISKLFFNVSPENACMTLGSKRLKSFVAGILDAHISYPLYGGNPVLTFSMDESIHKRFLHNVLLMFNSSIVETSCITSHAPKLLETAAILAEKFPIKNPAWVEVEDYRKPDLFSKTRGLIDTQTQSAQMIFEKQGFSPIVDGLYSYPSLLQK